MHRATGFMKDDRGGPLIEMAVLLVPFLLIFAIIVQGGDLFWRHQISQKAVRDAVRYVSRVQLLFDEACTLDSGVLVTTTASAKLLAATGSLDGGPPLVPNWTTANIQIPTPVVLSDDPCPSRGAGDRQCRSAAALCACSTADRSSARRHLQLQRRRSGTLARRVNDDSSSSVSSRSVGECAC